MTQRSCTCRYQAIAWKSWPRNGAASTAFASTTSGGFVFAGRAATPTTWRLPITIRSDMTTKELIEEMHPGRTIRKDVAEPPGYSINTLAKRLHVPASRLNDIVRARRGV